MSSPTILGRSQADILGGIGVALLQIKNANHLTLDDMGAVIGVSREMVAQYIAGETEMGMVKWLRVNEAWPELNDRLTHNLDEAEKAFRARQRTFDLQVKSA